MPNTSNSSLDGGKPIVALNQSTLSQVTSFSGALNAAAAIAGVSTLSIAAPMAREINKFEAGDYNPTSVPGVDYVFGAIKNTVAVYGSAAGAAVQTDTKLTEQEYVANLQYVKDNGISGAQNVGVVLQIWNRLENPTLNDLGIAKIQLGTAMDTVSYYKDNLSSFAGSDALNLLKYVNNTPQLVADLINPATTAQVSISLQAVIAQQANQWASSHIDGWSQYSDTDKASFTTAYSTLGQSKLNSLYQTYLDQGGDPEHYQPALGTTSGSEYLTWSQNGDPTNAEALRNALSATLNNGSGAIDPSAYPTEEQAVGLTNLPGVTIASESVDPVTGQQVLDIFFGDQTTALRVSSDNATIDYRNIDGVLQSQQAVLASGNELLKYYDTTNTHPWSERDIELDTNGKVTAAQVTLDQNIIAAGGSIGQVFGSAIGRALAPNNPFAQLAAGTVAGVIGQQLAQTFSASLLSDGSQVAIAGDFAGSGVNLAGAAAGSVASFLTAELGTALGLQGYGAQLFDAAVGSYAGSVLNQVVQNSLNSVVADIDWSQALGSSETSIAGALGSLLAHQFVTAHTQAGAIGGQPRARLAALSA